MKKSLGLKNILDGCGAKKKQRTNVCPCLMSAHAIESLKPPSDFFMPRDSLLEVEQKVLFQKIQLIRKKNF
jgi:hypothetical protein